MTCSVKSLVEQWWWGKGAIESMVLGSLGRFLPIIDSWETTQQIVIQRPPEDLLADVMCAITLQEAGIPWEQQAIPKGKPPKVPHHTLLCTHLPRHPALRFPQRRPSKGNFALQRRDQRRDWSQDIIMYNSQLVLLKPGIPFQHPATWATNMFGLT